MVSESRKKPVTKKAAKKVAKKATKKTAKKATIEKPRVRGKEGNEKPRVPLSKPRARMFAAEYIKDFNGTQAVLRLGWVQNGDHADNIAMKFMAYPAVHEYLGELMHHIDANVIATKALVMNKLWEEANTAKEGGARVNALSKLATYLGLDQRDPTETPDEAREYIQKDLTQEEEDIFKRKFEEEYGGG